MHPNDGRVVSNFIVQALQGEPITIYGDGSQTRSLLLRRRPDRRLHAADGRRPTTSPGPVNLGNPGEFTIRELAEKVIALTGSRSKLVHRAAARRTIPTQRQPGHHAGASAMLGWEPTVAARATG